MRAFPSEIPFKFTDDSTVKSATAPAKQSYTPTPSSPILPLQSVHTRDMSFSSRSSDVAPGPVPKLSRFSWTNSQAPATPRDPRESFVTTRSSVPRFRTVESWIDQQRRKVEARQEQNKRLSNRSSKGRELKEAEKALEEELAATRSKHVTQASDLTVFRHHPGTEVVVPRGSVVPSEILDTKIRAPVL